MSQRICSALFKESAEQIPAGKEDLKNDSGSAQHALLLISYWVIKKEVVR